MLGMRIRAAAVAAAVAAGTASPVALASSSPGSTARPTVVVAVADTGVNPYHQAFYRPENTAHPCTWVAGFTNCSIPALPLSVGKHADPRAAFEADRALWDSVELHQWYWIPKTNIIGAVCDTPVGGGATDKAIPYDGPTACIFDEHSHGTGTASSVLSEAPDALLLVHEGNAGAYDMESAPVVPDVQSHSWGFATPVPLQALRPVHEDPCDVGRAGPQTLVFLAAGNEAPMPSLLDCERARPEVQVVGGGYPGYVQANSWTVYDFASWYCRPTAAHESVKEVEKNCGTSFSAPTAAGTAAAALLRVRQHEGYSGRSTGDRVSRSLTREAFVEALRNAASYTPEVRFPDAMPCMDPTAAGCSGLLRSAGVVPLPEQAPHVFWGYGWLDATVTDAVVSCALGRDCPAKDEDARVYNENRQQLREASSMGALAPRSDDAGSGRDAGEDHRTAVPIRLGVPYAGQLGTQMDWGDGYAVRVKAGQRLTITSSASPVGTGSCWNVFDPEGRRLTATSVGNITSCDPGTAPPTEMRLEEAGVYLLEYWGHAPHDYSFTVRLTG